MSLMCQKNSFLQEYKSPVLSCQSSSLNLNGKQYQGFDVVLKDSIFFPEGGGQVCCFRNFSNVLINQIK